MSQNQSQSTSRQPSVLPPSTAYQRNFKLNNPSLALSSDSKTINGNELLLGDSTDGAYTRKWLNQAVTPVLLEGMKYLAREKPADPVKALGLYLLGHVERQAAEKETSIDEANPKISSSLPTKNDNQPKEKDTNDTELQNDSTEPTLKRQRTDED